MRSRQLLLLYMGIILLGVGTGLTSCSSASPATTSTPVPTPTTPLSSTGPQLGGPVPDVSCDQAIQLIEQNRVLRVQIYYYGMQNPSLLLDIDLIPRPGQQLTGTPGPIELGGETFVTFSPTMPDKCLSKVLAAIQQTNKQLPKQMQVIVSNIINPYTT